MISALWSVLAPKFKCRFPNLTRSIRNVMRSLKTVNGVTQRCYEVARLYQEGGQQFYESAIISKPA